MWMLDRWHLALLLMQNPSLKKYRKHRLPPKPEESNLLAEKLQQASNMLHVKATVLDADDWSPTAFEKPPKTTYLTKRSDDEMTEDEKKQLAAWYNTWLAEKIKRGEDIPEEDQELAQRLGLFKTD